MVCITTGDRNEYKRVYEIVAFFEVQTIGHIDYLARVPPVRVAGSRHSLRVRVRGGTLNSSFCLWCVPVEVAPLPVAIITCRSASPRILA